MDEERVLGQRQLEYFIRTKARILPLTWTVQGELRIGKKQRQGYTLKAEDSKYILQQQTENSR